ncbi:MAG: hypothetical protein COV31_01720 [Candidatus Yanofskybacteria bacterium CG10_big_fil_rev_8_21_14_0_10_46_23]|uniref:Uncharacterized protein n=1 Tax=Candidatus Yanofskybacteria bacterium CG10_big_fil_rev_8_21_14_0_10_46_23 TaxID=1975098 RepID=A0A2H0R685_9BACT|nr:MAG: hypothetical protein COV31_01720 [Candidatus Yanofskybacteria bacterium CG10_big_fil_rev_8_21_14_0_10_46_23]
MNIRHLVPILVLFLMFLIPKSALAFGVGCDGIECLSLYVYVFSAAFGLQAIVIGLIFVGIFNLVKGNKKLGIILLLSALAILAIVQIVRIVPYYKHLNANQVEAEQIEFNTFMPSESFGDNKLTSASLKSNEIGEKYIKFYYGEYSFAATLYESSPNTSYYSPPHHCRSNPERDGTYNRKLAFPCELLLITPGGVPLYIDKYSSRGEVGEESPFLNIYTEIDDTLLVIEGAGHIRPTNEEISDFIDSLEPTKPTEIFYKPPAGLGFFEPSSLLFD